MYKTHFGGTLILCVLQVFLCVLISRLVCTHTRSGNLSAIVEQTLGILTEVGTHFIQCISSNVQSIRCAELGLSFFKYAELRMS